MLKKSKAEYEAIYRVDAQQCIDRFDRENDKYVATPGDGPPGARLFCLAAQIIAVIASSPIPANFMKIVSPATTLARYLIALVENKTHFENVIEGLSQIVPDAGALYGNVEKIRNVLNFKAKVPYLESLKDLFAQGINDPQIAKMHGISIEKVWEYKADPTKIPADYVAPSIAKMIEEQMVDQRNCSDNPMELSCLVPALVAKGLIDENGEVVEADFEASSVES